MSSLLTMTDSPRIVCFSCRGVAPLAEARLVADGIVVCGGCAERLQEATGGAGEALDPGGPTPPRHEV